MNFLTVMRELETNGYPGISQVYLCILQYELDDKLCALSHIEKATCIHIATIKKYIKYLNDSNYITTINTGSYDTYKTKIVRATSLKRQQSSTLMRDIAAKLPMNYDEALRMERLVREIAQKSKDENSLLSELSSINQTVSRFKQYIGINTAKDLNDLLMIVNSQFTSWSSMTKGHLKQLLIDKHNATQALEKAARKTLDETTERARRIARNFALVLKRNPEWRNTKGTVNRDNFQEFYYGHVFDFPEDTIPLELVEQALNSFVPPIIIGD